MKRFLSVLGFLFLIVLYGCTPKDIAISFETNGGNAIETITEFDPETPSLPTPVRVGYTFDGWFEDEELTTEFDPLKARESWTFTLYAKWILIPYDITIEHYQEDLFDAYVLFETETISDFDEVITDVSLWENDYSGFEANATSIIDDDDISDVTIKLYYDRITYTLTIDEAGGDLVPDISAKYGYPILEPEMTRWAYTFSGWNVTFPETMPLNGGSITATWTPIPPVTVTFETNGGSLIPDFTAVPETEFNPPTPPTKQGYAFGGWYVDALLDEPFVFAPLGHEDITIYAKWNPINVDYTVDYYFESLTGDYLHLETLELQALTDSTITHVGLDRPGFSENTTHANRISVGVIAADGSTKLSIYYDRNDYTLSFDSNADLSITSITGPFESNITEPSDPTRSGYSFMGWYADEALTIPFVFNTMPFENTTVYAKWEGVPTDLFFDSHGGTMVSPIHAPLDSVITPPANPTKEGYHFAGWYLHEDLVNAFTDWVMPFGSITLHAKWTPNDYTVSFEENGGSLVTDITAPYLSTITAPSNPTKADYVFSGWYSDSSLTQAFSFNTMPLSGITLYAKWISLEEATELQNIIHLAEGTYIELEVTIYAMQYGDYQGFYVFDSTGFIFIHASKSGLEVGDLISLTGVLHFWNDVPVIGNVANIQFISAANALTSYPAYTIDVITDTVPTVEIFSSIGVTTGVLVLENGIYRIYNPRTEASVAIAPQFVNKTQLDPLVGDVVGVVFLFESYMGEWRIGYQDINDTLTTDSDKALMIEDWIKSQYQSSTYYPNEYFEFPSVDPYSWGTIQIASTTQNELQLDPSSLQFLATDISQLVVIPVTVTINATIHTFDLTVQLNPLEITSIHDFLLTVARGQTYHLQGIAVLVYDDWNYCLLDDGTAAIMIYCEDYTYGDELLISAVRMLGDGYIEISKENLLAIRLISRNNSLENPALVMSPTELTSLDPTDSSLYGTYVELRGFLLQSSMDSEYHHYFSLTDNQTFSIPIEPIGYAGFEQLFNYVGLEVIIRGYLFDDYSLENGFSLGFLGIREDIKLPNYTDEERINMIQTLFANDYAGESFQPFDAFPLYPHHTILGGDISWVFTNGSDAYFDFDTETFKFVDVSTPISIAITISKNAFSATYTYTTTLEPLDYRTVSEIKEIEQYNEVYVKGLVVFRDPYFLYIQDETGLLRVESYSGLDCYKGDIVVIWGIKFFSESYNQRGMTYLSNDRDEPKKMVISILSRDNPVVIDQSELSLSQVVNLDPFEPNSYTQYVTLSGRLTDSIDHYGYYELSMGLNSVLISALDDYTWYKMELLLDTHERSVDVTLDLFLNDYDFDYQHWMMIYTGQTETAYPIFTDLDRADLIEDWLIESYNTEVIANQSSFTFAPSYPATFTNSITYVTHGDYAAVIDVVNGIIHDVPVTTNVLITATFTVGAITRDVELVMTVLKDNEVSTTVSLISDFIASNSTEVQTIVGLIIAIASIENGGYAFIVEDPSGTLIVRMPSNYWYWDYNMVGKELTATGTHVLVDGRNEMIATSTTIGVTAFTIIENFEPYTFGELSSIDLLNTDLIGQPMQLTGRLIRDDYGRYYLTDGLNQVILNFTYPMSNDEIYATDLTTLPLNHWMIQVQGQLMYDKYLDQFYLTDGTNKLYIRENLEFAEEEYYYYEEGPTYLDLNVLYELVYDQVIMRFFFPLKYTMLDYYMVDFRGLYEDLMIPELTPQEHATMAANKAAMKLSDMTFTPGDSLYDYFPWGDEYHNAELDFTVQNATDALYFDFNNGGFVKIIPASQDVVITVTATRYDYIGEDTVISTASADFTVHLEALETSTVREVLWGEAYKSYILEGVVEMHYFDWWIILSDGSGRIYIDANGYNSYYDIPEIANGDLIQILGRKDFYEGNDYVPVMDSVIDIKVISGGHAITNTATAMTVQEILDLDYLNPDTFNQYVIITGDVIRYGSSTYPGYEIHEAGTPTDRSYNIQLYADTYMPFNDMMLAYVGDVVTVEGYLIGFEYIYDRFDWIVIYVDHEVITNN